MAETLPTDHDQNTASQSTPTVEARPISPWHLTAKGAAIGARIGVIIWLSVSFFRFFSIDGQVNLEDFLRGGVSFWLLVIIIFWIRPFFPKSSDIYKASGLGPLIGGIAAILFTMSRFPGFTLKGSLMMLGFACQVTTGAMIAGAAVCVWPGMVIGSILGLAWRKKQTASRKRNIIICGIIMPLVVFSVVVVLYLMLISYLTGIFEKSWF